MPTGSILSGCQLSQSGFECMGTDKGARHLIETYGLMQLEVQGARHPAGTHALMQMLP